MLTCNSKIAPSFFKKLNWLAHSSHLSSIQTHNRTAAVLASAKVTFATLRRTQVLLSIIWSNPTISLEREWSIKLIEMREPITWISKRTILGKYQAELFWSLPSGETFLDVTKGIITPIAQRNRWRSYAKSYTNADSCLTQHSSDSSFPLEIKENDNKGTFKEKLQFIELTLS